MIEDQRELRAYRMHFNDQAPIGVEINKQPTDYDLRMRIKRKFISLLEQNHGQELKTASQSPKNPEIAT